MTKKNTSPYSDETAAWIIIFLVMGIFMGFTATFLEEEAGGKVMIYGYMIVSFLAVMNLLSYGKRR